MYARIVAVTAALAFSFACRREVSLAAVTSAPQRGRARPAAHAGSWYPADPGQLRSTLASLLAAAPARPQGAPVIAVVAPHAGLRYSGAVAAKAFAPLARQSVRRVFLIGPSHREVFSGVALPPEDFAAYATPLGDLPIDTETVAALRGAPGFDGPAGVHAKEHSLEMHAIFVAAVAPSARIVPLVVGQVTSVETAGVLARRLRSLLGPGDVVAVSSDFTHYGASYGYLPFREHVTDRLEGLAAAAIGALLARDLEGFRRHLTTTGDTICGRDPLMLLLVLLPAGVRGERVGFDTSGRMTGDGNTSVSYAALTYELAAGWPAVTGAAVPRAPSVLDEAAQRTALRMARRTLEIVLAGGALPDAATLGVPAAPVWHAPHATFVTLERRGELRGCIGHIEPVQPLWRDLRDNAIAAARSDPRFAPVTAVELAELDIEISILTAPVPAAGPQAFVVGRHGVVLALGEHRAVFLPQVAPEQGWDRETTLRHLARKAGLPEDAWRSSRARFWLFEGQVFHEPTRAGAP